jgi:hypothetical protein
VSTHIGLRRVADRHVGRFSEGLEQLPESASTLHVGRFSEGIEASHPDALHAGRFSEGMEREGETAWKLHAGSFAEGFADVRRATPHRRPSQPPEDHRRAVGAARR